MFSNQPTIIMETLVVGTRNEGKIRELHELFSDFPFPIRGLSSFEDPPIVIEDRETLPGNAIKKVETFAEYTNFPTVSDDSGLEVQALDGKPGVKTARFAGEDASTDENIDLLLEKMKGVDNRRAQFRTVLAYVDPNGFVHTFHGTIRGIITESRRGSKGFGYDPVFRPEGHDKTFGEMNKDLKNEISHRRRALDKFHSFLSNK